MRPRGLPLLVLALSVAACDAPPQPVASAGAPQTVAVRQIVQLDGSGSMSRRTVPNAQITRYEWAFTAVPNGSAAALNQPGLAKSSFVPDLPGAYDLRLTVWDGNGAASATVTVTAVACAPKLAAVVAAPAMPNVGDDVTLSVGVMKGEGCDDRPPFSYAWVVAGAPPGSRAALLPNAAVAAPSFHVDVPGEYKLAVRVTDGAGRPSDTTFTVTAGNCGHNAPVVSAIAATPATPNTGDVVQLAATVADADTDPMGACKRTQALSYAWSLVAAPNGSAAKLSAAGAANPWIQPDVNGAYVVRLVVTDDAGVASAAKDFTLTAADCGSKAPVVAAVTPSTLAPALGQTVNLAATVTSDDLLAPCSKLETFTYAWALVAQPGPSTAKLQNASTATPSLVPDVAGTYRVQLTVTASNGKVSLPVQSAAIVASTCGLSPPVAQIGVNAPYAVAAPAAAPPAIALQAPLNVALQLDANTSSDPDNAQMCGLKQTLSYQWRFESLPVGSKAAFNDARSATPSFTPDVPGPYLINLVATDNAGVSSAAARVLVNGFNPAPVVLFGVAPTNTSLALDGANADPRLAYYHKTRGEAHVAACTGPACAVAPVWGETTADSSSGRHVSIAAGTGALYLANWNEGNCSPRYAVSQDAGKTWVASTLQTNPQACLRDFGQPNNCDNSNVIDYRDNGAFPSLAVSPNSGNPAVAYVGYVQGPLTRCRNNQNNYVDAGWDEVRYAVCTANCKTANPTWSIVTAATAVRGGNTKIGYVSLAFDPSTRLPAITFRATDTGNGRNGVGYVTCTANCEGPNAAFSGVAWIETDRGFDTYALGNVGTESTTTSLAIGSAGQAYVAYYDSLNQWLRLANCKSNCNLANNWSVSVLDGGGAGQYASLALSPLQAQLDRPRLAYLGGGALRYAQLTDAGWSFTTLDASNGYMSLKLTANDGPRVSYSGGNAVRYFTSGF